MRSHETTGALRRHISAGIVGVFLVILPPQTEGSESGHKLRMAVLLKVLSYDRALTKRVKGKLIITILYKKGVKRSERARVALTKVLTAAEVKIQGLPIAVNTVAHSAETLESDVRNKATDVLYVTPGVDVALEATHAAAKKNGAITVCEERALVKAGLAVGVFLRDRRAKIAVNLERARSLGMSLDASLLSLVEVFR